MGKLWLFASQKNRLQWSSLTVKETSIPVSFLNSIIELLMNNVVAFVWWKYIVKSNDYWVNVNTRSACKDNAPETKYWI